MPSPEEILLERLQSLNISSLSHTFANFKVTDANRGIVKIFKTIPDGKCQYKFILLYGTTGCGKTHLIEALILEWDKMDIRYRYTTIGERLRALRQCLDKNHIPSLQDVMNSYFVAPRLILDDYGMGITESIWEQSILEEIIDERYRRRFYPQEMITILTTNKDIKELPDRVVSRFKDPDTGIILFNSDSDYRRRKHE